MELLRADSSHHNVEDTELPSSQGTDHDPTRAEAHRAQVDETGLSSDVAEARQGAAGATCARFVDLGEQGIRRVRDGRRSYASNHTREQ